LVDPGTFDLVQARLSDPRRKTQQGTDRKHLGSGLYVCAVCESPIRAWSGNRYRCPNGCITRAQASIDALVLKLVTARLSRPDLVKLLPDPNEGNTKQLLKELSDLRIRLKVIEDDYDAGHIDGQRFAIASERVKTQLGQVEARIGSNASDATQILRANNPAKAFFEAPLMLKRAAIGVLCTFKLHPAPRGRKNFDPESVVADWRTGSHGGLELVQPTMAGLH
jgi:site-specific DNA recombinase